MTWYELWLFVHIAAAMIWIGGAFVAQVLGVLAKRSGDPARSAAFGRDLAFVGPKVFMPASLVVVASGGKRVVRLRTRVKGVTTTLGEADAGEGALTMFVEATPDAYSFGFETAAGERRVVGTAPAIPLSSELAGGFTGAVFGLFASSRADTRGNPADFDWFELESR